MRLTAWSRSDGIHGCISQSQAVAKITVFSGAFLYLMARVMMQIYANTKLTTFFNGQTLLVARKLEC